MDVLIIINYRHVFIKICNATPELWVQPFKVGFKFDLELEALTDIIFVLFFFQRWCTWPGTPRMYSFLFPKWHQTGHLTSCCGDFAMANVRFAKTIFPYTPSFTINLLSNLLLILFLTNRSITSDCQKQKGVLNFWLNLWKQNKTNMKSDD